MKPYNTIVTLFVAFLFTIATPLIALGIWIGPSGDDDFDTELIRIDITPKTYHHEIDNGRYAYWESTTELVVVIDFSTPNGMVTPFTWNDVHWVPDPRDWVNQSSIFNPFEELCSLLEPQVPEIKNMYNVYEACSWLPVVTPVPGLRRQDTIC